LAKGIAAPSDIRNRTITAAFSRWFNFRGGAGGRGRPAGEAKAIGCAAILTPEDNRGMIPRVTPSWQSAVNRPLPEQVVHLI
jgi:hypothetical protein